jgi:P-loop containing NTP hydrolase pore-1
MPEQSTGVCAARTNALVCNIHELITELEERIEDGEPFDNPKLTRTAERVFGGSRAQGKYTPRDAYDAVEIAVNNYLLEKHARQLMQMDVTEALASVLRPLMQRLPRQTDRTLEQNELQQFSTPPTLAYLATRLLNPKPSDIVLEPSAGTGSLAIWPRAVGAKVICNETSLRRFSLLRCVLNFEPFPLDAEFIDDLLPTEIQPTAVLMNPPFSSTSGRVKSTNPIYGARHVASALRRLKEGGRLVAIVSEAMSFHHPSFSEWWQRIACLCNIRANLTLDGREYAKYGAAPDVQILVIDKTGATPGRDWKEQLKNIRWGEAKSIENAWTQLSDLAERNGHCDQHERNTEQQEKASQALPADQPTDAQVAISSNEPDPERDQGEEASGDVFIPYVPSKLRGGKPHPAVIVESASMAAVVPPDITYKPNLAPEIISEGRLSDIQLERVIYAGQRHEQRLPDGSRAGFFVGDGTGVGKGRVLAGIIADNWNQGRKRAIWFSVNNDLLEDSRRDLADLGLTSIALARINDYPATGEITLPRGVIFSSYSSLIAAAKTGQKRIDQIQRWLGSDGVVIFDEAHKAKNALAGGRGEPTLTGQQ